MAARSSIRFWRERAGLSQAALAQQLGIRPDRLSRYETGDALPDLSEVEAIAKALGVTVASLYSENTLRAIAEGEAA